MDFAMKLENSSTSDMEYSFLAESLEKFDSDPNCARRSLRDLLSKSSTKFASAAFRVLREGGSSSGLNQLQSLIIENDLLVTSLTDPAAFSLESAINLAKSLMPNDPLLDTKLIKRVMPADQIEPFTDVRPIVRALDILEAISECGRLAPSLMKLAHADDDIICSKAARLAVRCFRTNDSLHVLQLDSDPRVRASLAEAMMHISPSPKELEILKKLAGDAHNRVCSTALMVLYRNGYLPAGEELLQMSHDSNELNRLAAICALGQTGDLKFLPHLQRIVKRCDGNLKRMAIQACIAIRKPR